VPDDAEQAELLAAPAEYGRGIDAAEGEDGAEAVGIEHARGEEQRDLAMVLEQVLDRADELAEPRSHRSRFEGPARPVGREQKERQHEHEIPSGRERSDQAVAFARRRIERNEGCESEQRLAAMRIGNDEPQHQNQTDKATDIACRPAEAG
jgi:hypothetical protein